jgi:hypothetical protein
MLHFNEEGVPDFAAPLTFEYVKEEGQWVGFCLELGTSTFADSLEELRKELADSVSLQLDEMERLGYIQPYLREQGIHLTPIAEPGQSDSSRRFVLAGSSI